jgi:hypothetical protein
MCMSVSFNSDGNLHKTIELSIDEFKTIFGTNASRIEKIRNALVFFEIFRSCGCTAVYIGGSFVSTKKNPEDIDLCFDFNDIDRKKLEIAFPGFYDFNTIGKIRRDSKCHILYFNNENTYYFRMLQQDRNGHPKGMVKIYFKNHKI